MIEQTSRWAKVPHQGGQDYAFLIPQIHLVRCSLAPAVESYNFSVVLRSLASQRFAHHKQL